MKSQEDPTTHNKLTLARETASLRQQVVTAIRDAILFGGLAPGQKLSERELCANLGVSRTLLREGLQQLQAEGLIVNVMHKGPSVASLTREQARDIYKVRGSLEALAAKEFTQNATNDQRKLLAQRLKDIKKAGTQNDSHDLVKAKNAFYDVLISGCGNAVVGQMLTTLNNRVTILRRQSLATPGRLSKSLEELQAILKAIEAGDGDLAGQLCAQHVDNAADIVLSQFSKPRK
ncbi:GntR family transcriptional regulator [Solimonas marina]|uniref:GntR family transcriptional regulator n=1 Tax=Solimonas marina TaxID=2714601 RepID=UPI0019D28AC7|nr:GntR family transcriptional regulator [Solimonas marina]